ncbi:hypothetical protein ACRN9F_11200 [Shewanella oncorhynchi]|uniref:hypothetical protein n=1 Tax=Shewanella oncorhynchi TaxID=2726434 RepID=UPI003D79E180
MIDWRLIALDRDSSEIEIDLLLLSDESNSLRETDSILFKVSIDNETFIEKGTPYILIGDIPLELEFHSNSGGNRVFISSEPLGHQRSRYFYNFFGESELGLTFNGDNKFLATCTVNILARTENAQLASEMLDYITDNLEDAVAICFSRSKVTVGHDRDSSFKFTRLDVIEKTIDFLLENLPVFIREHKHTWRSEMQLSDRGQPTGPDSVYWVLSNLDRLTPANRLEANLVYNNRGYRLDILPKEGIVSESDIYENRVIHTFLHNTSLFLIEIRGVFGTSIDKIKTYLDNDYVRFDHTMQKYKQLALKHKIQIIDNLLFSVENIKKVLYKELPAKVVPGLQPRMTSYVAKHPHYSQAFNLIEQCNAAPAPTFEGNSILLGLKNLSIIYEISSLLMLNESIKRCFTIDTFEQNYRYHSKDLPFGGAERVRPYGKVNNYFTYRNEMYDIELFYEPKIYQFGPMSTVGDLVDTSDSRATSQYGPHFFCPDFILKIRSKRWRKPLTVVLDSKYKDANTIKNFDIVTLTQKYLLNIHQVNERGGFGISPIQLLLVLFAHDKAGSNVKTVASRHCLTGSHPVFPQAAGVIFKPSNTAKFDENLKVLIEIMNRELY